jgi:hypothetical protein
LNSPKELEDQDKERCWCLRIRKDVGYIFSSGGVSVSTETDGGFGGIYGLTKPPTILSQK